MAARISVSKLAQEIGRAHQENDLETLDALRECFRESEADPALPLSARVALDEKRVEADHAVAESETALTLANSLSRARRAVSYRLDKAQGVRRPVIVSEGDSWFQYPIRLKDTIDQLVAEHGYQLLSLGAAGDLISNMAAAREYEKRIEEEKADFFLLSGGGNDMLGGGRLATFIKGSGTTPEEWLDREAWEGFLSQIASLYRGLFRSLVGRFPSTTILCHGYDYALPRGQRWLGKPLSERGVPESDHAAIVRILIDGFNDKLVAIATEFETVHHVDCRDVVGETKSSWYDELHPTNAGFGRVAEKFHERIEELWDAAGGEEFVANAPAVEGGPVPDPPMLRHLRETPLSPAEQMAMAERASAISPYGALDLPSKISEVARPTLTRAARGGEDASAEARATVDPYVATAQRLREMKAERLPQDVVVAHGLPVFSPEVDEPPEARLLGVPPDVFEIAGRVRAGTETVLTEGLIPDSSVPGIDPLGAEVGGEDAYEPLPVGPELDELLRRPPCESLRVWQAHVAQDRENLVAYEEFRKLRAEFDQLEDAERIQQRRRLLPIATLAPQERILGESDLFQVHFLSRGVRATRAVGRISVFNEHGISLGSGTGFLVGPGLLLTNNHVLPERRSATHSHVLFDYEYDENHALKTTERFQIADEIFCTSATHDFTFVSVAPIGSLGNPIESFGSLKLIRESGKALKGEPVSIIQHADGLPKQIAIRNSRVIGRGRQFIYYLTDTNPGSSGAPVLNDQWLPVALHHRSVPHFFRTCEYVANRGIRISAIYDELNSLRAGGDRDAGGVLSRLEEEDASRSEVVVGDEERGSFADAVERNVEPFHEVPYDGREGYDPDFLGIEVPLPSVVDPESVAAPLLGTRRRPRYELKYEHCSIVMNRIRRLALLTAANVDYSPPVRRPDTSRPKSDYTRRGLGGLGRNDREKWFLDPRIAVEHQLPDVFYNRDRKAFHKGHLVRRDAVAWGRSYRELRRANGDTFHVTNCSPQVGKFNVANSRGPEGIWGDLEKLVEREAKSERLCVFSGPVFSDQDRDFSGVDDDGEVVVPIPSFFWKLIVARKGRDLHAFAFWLQQDLTGVAFEFAVPSDLRRFQISVEELERKLGVIEFSREIHDADRK